MRQKKCEVSLGSFKALLSLAEMDFRKEIFAYERQIYVYQFKNERILGKVKHYSYILTAFWVKKKLANQFLVESLSIK